MASQPTDPGPDHGQGSQDRQTPPIPGKKRDQDSPADPNMPPVPSPDEGQGSQNRRTPPPG
jgi:hypothetical protein